MNSYYTNCSVPSNHTNCRFEIIYLLKKANLSMCVPISRGMSVVCTWGLRGICFLTLVLFVLFYHGAAVCFCVSPFSYVCTVQ